MIEYRTGDMFESGADVLVCPVNCVGAMGKGLALEFKKRYPDLEGMYQNLLRTGDLAVGKTALVLSNHQYILLFPTKWHWKEPSSLLMIEKGLISMLSWHVFYHSHPFGEPKTVAIPKIGCGLGGLEWQTVKNMMETVLDEDTYEYLTARFLVYE